MPTIYRLESSDPAIHGLAVLLLDGKPAIATQWRHAAPLSDSDCLELAKGCAAHVLQRLLEQGRNHDAINWPSVVAAMQRHIMDVNAGVKARAYDGSAPFRGGGVAGDRLLQ